MQNYSEDLKQEIWQKLFAVFNRYTSGGHQQITLEQLGNLIREVLHEDGETEMAYVMRNMALIDANHNGLIEFDEFANYLIKRHCGEMALQNMHKEKLAAPLTNMKLTNADLCQLFNDAFSFISVRVERDLSDKIFQQLDSNKDGFISYVEYFRFIEAFICETQLSPSQNNRLRLSPVKVHRPIEDVSEVLIRFRRLLWGQLFRIYIRYDSDGNGDMDQTEMKKLLKDLLNETTKSELDYVFKNAFRMDLNGDMRFVFQEFSHFFIKHSCEIGLNRFNRARPTGGRRDISPEDFLKLFRSCFCYLEQYIMTDELVTRVFQKIDKDKDGSISYKEYLQWTNELLAYREPCGMPCFLSEPKIEEIIFYTPMKTKNGEESPGSSSRRKMEEEERVKREKYMEERDRKERERFEKERKQLERYDREKQQKIKREKQEMVRLQKERDERQRNSIDKMEKEQLQRAKQERAQEERERQERERLEKIRLMREREARQRQEKERIERERRQKEQAERERIERERIEYESLLRQRKDWERSERLRQQRQNLERDRLRNQPGTIEHQRLERLRREQETRSQQSDIDKQKQERERLERIRQEREKQEDRFEIERLEREREKELAAQKAREELNRRNLQRSQWQQIQRTRQENDRVENMRLAREREAREREEREQREREEKERRQRDQAERERIERQRAHQNFLDRQRQESQRVDRLHQEQENLERERIERERRSRLPQTKPPLYGRSNNSSVHASADKSVSFKLPGNDSRHEKISVNFADDGTRSMTHRDRARSAVRGFELYNNENRGGDDIVPRVIMFNSTHEEDAQSARSASKVPRLNLSRATLLEVGSIKGSQSSIKTYSYRNLAERIRQHTLRLLRTFDLNRNDALEQEEIVEVLNRLLRENELEVKYVTRNFLRYKDNFGDLVRFEYFVNFFLGLHCGEMAVQRFHFKHMYSCWKERIMNEKEFIMSFQGALDYVEFLAPLGEVKRLFREIDEDADGWISYKEYFEFLKNFFSYLPKSTIEVLNKYPTLSGIVTPMESPYYSEHGSEPDEHTLEETIGTLIRNQTSALLNKYATGQLRIFPRNYLSRIFKDEFGMDQAEIEYCLLSFSKYDGDRDGSLTIDELTTLIMEVYCAEVVLQRLHRQKRFLQHQERMLSQQDFIVLVDAAFSYLSFKPRREDLIAIFKSLDLSHSGTIGYNRFVEFVRDHLTDRREDSFRQKNTTTTSPSGSHLASSNVKSTDEEDRRNLTSVRSSFLRV